MTDSKYEEYVVRKPALVVRVGDEHIRQIPETDDQIRAHGGDR